MGGGGIISINKNQVANYDDKEYEEVERHIESEF